MPDAVCSAAFCPLDPDWPEERAGAILRSAAAALLVTDGPHAGSAEAAGIPVHGPEVLGRAPGAGAENRGLSPVAGPSSHRPRLGTGGDGAAVARMPWCYVLFTSGSTGQPVGIRGTEQGERPGRGAVVGLPSSPCWAGIFTEGEVREIFIPCPASLGMPAWR